MADATDEEKESYRTRAELKDDQVIPDPSTRSPILSSAWVADELRRRMDSLPFKDYFQTDTTLVPIPRSGLSLPNQLWVPERIAKAMVRLGIGSDVCTALSRVIPVQRSSTSRSWERPLTSVHFASMSVANTITNPQQIVLVDDFVTRGATSLGAANRILTRFPEAQIKLFAAIRTQSRRLDFQYDKGPVEGTITLLPNGATHREP